ncbi:MAG: malectin domain-containing carbohydrate-binding protein [Myxococcales bacterium]
MDSRCAARALLALAVFAGCGDGSREGREGGESRHIETVGGATAVTTFHSIGLYWAPAGGSASRQCNVQYRRINTNEAWKTGYPLWFDSRVGPNGQYKGSLVLLQPGTTYEIKLDLAGSPATSASLNATTWSETFPVGATVTLPATSSSTLTIAQSGTPDAYRLYTAAPGGSTIDANGNADQNIVINNASYVIIRGVTLKNARINAIELRGNVHDVVIEENDVSGWGRIFAPDGFGEVFDAGVYAHNSTSTVERIIVQRNRFHHPRADSNSWEEPRPIYNPSNPNHALGPEAITLFDSKGNHVFRYNTVFSDDQHRFTDAFGAGDNHSPTAGFPAVDSDIYGNRISHCWDDAIESEGANRNVRIWGNFTENNFVHIAVASTQAGPVYIFRNVSGITRETGTDINPNWDTVGRGGFLKTKQIGGGKVFVFHNTILQPPPPPGFTFTIGADPGLGHGEGMTNVYSRNNILHIHKDWHTSIADTLHDPQGDYDYDLYNGVIDALPGNETNGRKGKPTYASGNGPGEFALDRNSLGFDQGVVLPGFNDGYTGLKPDMGAFEEGSPPMEFGVDAYRNPTPQPLTLPAAINAGGPAVAPYLADTHFAGGSVATNWTGAIDTAGVVEPAPEAVYQTERYGNSSYTMTGLTAGRVYHVRLHFAENFAPNVVGSRKFDVNINGALVLDDFDVLAAAGAQHKAVVREFDTAATGSGQVVIAFITVAQNALINGIEVRGTPGAPFSINAGGAPAPPFVADTGFSGGSTATNWTSAIDTSAVAHPAPPEVYQSERYGNSTYTLTDLTPGTRYLVRLHFCENYAPNNTVGSRKFDVTINGTLVLDDYDILAEAGAQHRAVAKEFVVTANATGQILLGFTDVVQSALINGIEVLDVPANQAICGDSVVTPPEVCDDGVNNGAYNGCAPRCLALGPHCGDKTVNGPETCDDGNMVNGDGCSATCSVEPSVNGPVSVNAGGPALAPFVADSGFSGGTTVTNWTGAIDLTAAPGAAPEAVYRTERFGDMTYTIAGLTSGASYDVRLHFAENWFTTAGQRKFNVAINGAAVLTNFDVFAAAGAQHKAVVRESSRVANANGRIVIAFASVTDKALINGIEVLAPPINVAGPVSINAGGAAVAPYVADVGFSGGTAVTNWTGAIDTTGVFRPAPTSVYQAERFGDMTYTVGGLSSGRSYHVRLHFAENWWSAAGQRRFNVAINGAAVLTNFDVFATAGAAHKAVVREFVAVASNLGRIVLSFTGVTDRALINGIEVLVGEFVQDATGLVSLEAENRVGQTSASGHDWVFATDVPGYSGIGAMRGDPDSNNFFDVGYVTTSPRLDYLVRFDRTGTHYVIVRAQGPHGMSDSVHVGLDGAAIASADRIGNFPTTFAWQNNTGDAAVATIDVPTAGLHAINVWMREDGVVFDKLVLTPSSTFMPTGTGPAETR